MTGLATLVVVATVACGPRTAATRTDTEPPVEPDIEIEPPDRDAMTAAAPILDAGNSEPCPDGIAVAPSDGVSTLHRRNNAGVRGHEADYRGDRGRGLPRAGRPVRLLTVQDLILR